MTGRGVKATREQDDRDLVILELRVNQGVGPHEIGRLYGKTGQFISTICNRIRNADLEESERPTAGPERLKRQGVVEPRREVLKEYW